jgi:hypothetical protein
MVPSGFSGTLLLTHQDQENQAQLEANLQTAEARTPLDHPMKFAAGLAVAGSFSRLHLSMLFLFMWS